MESLKPLLPHDYSDLSLHNNSFYYKISFNSDKNLIQWKIIIISAFWIQFSRCIFINYLYC